tara:strand:- start:172 stop:324 length:153 start_codon:yes stop_codon:yes gene_type:complete
MKKFFWIIGILIFLSSCQNSENFKKNDFSKEKKNKGISLKATTSGVEIKN